MNYNRKIIRKSDTVSKKWSGGITTEIIIYPENSVYDNRDFLWRISSAVVESEESKFTQLNGYNRLLMNIEGGNLKLSHKEHHEITLKQFEVDSFSGSWDTNSKGCITDFNVIFKEGIHATLYKLDDRLDKIIVKVDEENLKDKNNSITYILFCQSMSGEVVIDKYDSIILKKGDALIIDIPEKSDHPEVLIKHFSDMILATVF